MKAKTWVIGDVHGASKALEQAFERAEVNYKKDHVISLGDTADGWSQAPHCVEIFERIDNLTYIMGNHDKWLLDFYLSKNEEERTLEYMWKTRAAIWLSQGGMASRNAYHRLGEEVIKEHRKFYERAKLFHIDEHDRLFVHAGYRWEYPFGYTLKSKTSDLYWDRDLWSKAYERQKLLDNGYPLRPEKQLMGTEFDEIYIGHTTVMPVFKGKEDEVVPLKGLNVWNLDTGGGFAGKVTIMNVDTKEFFQSDLVKTLYHDEKGR